MPTPVNRSLPWHSLRAEPYRGWLALLRGGCLILLLGCKQVAGESIQSISTKLITPAVERGIDRGLAFLNDQQQDDGSFGSSGYRRNVAVCSLAGLAYLSSGSTPGRGPHGEAINRCIDYLLKNTDASGLIAAPAGTERGPMYGHGFATLFLSETYGMSLRKDLRDHLAEAIDLIVRTQNQVGGWRYQPRPQDADLSVTVCQIMALRAGRNAGIAVPKETIDRAMNYVQSCQNRDGGFRYMPPGGGKSERGMDGGSQFARSAAGVVAFTNGGIYAGEDLERGLRYLDAFLPSIEGSRAKNRKQPPYYFYGHYYAVQAMWHAGKERWVNWYPAIGSQLLERQQEDGSWEDAICSEYGTAMACIILQVPNNYLPILHR